MRDDRGPKKPPFRAALLAGLIVLCLAASAACAPEAPSSSSSPSDEQINLIIPRALCWEYREGQTSAFWDYTNPSSTLNVTDRSKNSFYVNGAALETSVPPTFFESGNFSLAALITLNLGPTGLDFEWTIGTHSAHMIGGELFHQCPNVSMTIELTTSATPSNTSGLPSLLASALSIEESRITVSSATSSKRASLATLPITIAASSNGPSSILASYQLKQLLLTDSQFQDDISQAIGTDVVGSTPDTSQIDPALPITAVPSKKDEIWAGTIVGIVFASVFGTAIVLIFLTAVFFRFTSYREEKRLDKMTERMLVRPRPLISPSTGETSKKDAVQNGDD